MCAGRRGKTAANHQDKRESHLWTLVSRKVVTLASEVRADDRNENDMFVEDEENG